MAREFPKDLYHRTLPPKRVLNRAEQTELGSEWFERYIHQEYPRIIYRSDGSNSTANSEGEEKALMAQNKEGEPAVWSRTPFPPQPKPERGTTAGIQHTGALDAADTFQKFQIMEFEIETLKEQVQDLNAAVTELRRSTSVAPQGQVAAQGQKAARS